MDNQKTLETTRTTRTDYVVSSDLFQEDLIQILRHEPVAIVVDSTVALLYGQRFHQLSADLSPLGVLQLNGGEQCKSMNGLIQILTFLSECGLPKHGWVIAVGGGTICDIVATAASLFRRGVPLALVPTTLLSQIDAAIGGKTGLNFHHQKNLIGNFYHPANVVCDISFLETLKHREIVGGFAEALKIFAMHRANDITRFFGQRPADLTNFSMGDRLALVRKCVQQKLALIEEDPFELSSRRLLNYGHAFAHYFEEESGFFLGHGEAVLIGMTIENMISFELGLAGQEVNFLQDIINSYFTENCLRFWISVEKVLPLIERVRATRRNKLNFVCLKKLGDAEIVDDISDEIILAAWKNTFSLLTNSIYMCRVDHGRSARSLGTRAVNAMGSVMADSAR